MRAVQMVRHGYVAHVIERKCAELGNVERRGIEGGGWGGQERRARALASVELNTLWLCGKRRGRAMKLI